MLILWPYLMLPEPAETSSLKMESLAMTETRTIMMDAIPLAKWSVVSTALQEDVKLSAVMELKPEPSTATQSLDAPISVFPPQAGNAMPSGTNALTSAETDMLKKERSVMEATT